MGPVLYPEGIYDTVSHLIFSMSFYITFKRKLYIVGHIRIPQWVNKCDPLSTLLETIQRMCVIVISTSGDEQGLGDSGQR